MGLESNANKVATNGAGNIQTNSQTALVPCKNWETLAVLKAAVTP